MKQFTIELPESFDIRRQGVIVTIPLADMPAHIIREYVLHGATQKVGDAAAGKADTDAIEAMHAVIARNKNGEWTGRAAGAAGEPPINRFIRQVMRGMKSVKENSDFKSLAAKDRDAWLMEKFAAQSDDVQTQITTLADELMAKAKAAEAAKAKLAASVTIDI